MSKIFLLGDVHLGVHKLEEDKWLDVVKNFFFNFYMEILDEKYEEGDSLFILGDFFDNRQYLSIKTVCYALDIFNELEKRNIDVHILIGNHDMWADVSYQYNSLRILEKYSNVTIYKKPTILHKSGKKILMCPWITQLDTLNKELKKFSKSSIDYLFIHSDLAGARSNVNNILKHGPTVAEFVNFSKIYASHIHIRQKHKNFQYIGSPYHLDRNDKGNKKGVFILNLENETEEFIENNYSPEYKTLEIYEESDVNKINRLISIDNVLNDKDDNNWYDVVIKNSLIIKNEEVRKKLTSLTKSNRVSKLSQIDDIVVNESNDDSFDLDDVGVDLDIINMIIEYITNQKIEDDIKNEILDELNDSVKILKSNE